MPHSIYVILLFLSLSLQHCSSVQTNSDSAARPDVTPVDDGGPRSFEKEGAFQLQSSKKKPKNRPIDHVAPGNTIRISSVADRSLNGTFRVDFNGTLELPYKKEISTDGLTWAHVQDKINQAYKGFFKTAPNLQMTWNNKEYYVAVRGLVEKPGQYLVDKTTTLDELISKSKGLQKAREGETLAKYVRIKQYGHTRVIKLSDYYNGSQEFSPSWDGGDLVFFQSERGDVSTEFGIDPNYVRILGEVRSPGEYLHNENGDFFYYLSKAGGPTSSTNPEKVRLIRQFQEGKRSLEFSMNDVERLPIIEGGDIIMIEANRDTSFERGTRVGASIASILTSIATVILVIIAL